MLDKEQDSGDTKGAASAPDSATDSAPKATSPPPPVYDESIVEEIGALIDDAKLYATAELAFQKTRANLAGKSVGIALGAVILAIILLHIALISMAVGLVIALEPLVTIWGAIAIVAGVMLLGVGALGYVAASKGRLIAEMFASPPIGEASDDGEEA